MTNIASHRAANRKARRAALLAATAIAFLGADVGTAYAQLETVIVTARKKQENVQNIPVAVTAISGEKMDQYSMSSIEGISATTPELQVTRGNSGSGADISLRGIGSSFTSVGIEQSVAVDVDGVYYGQGRTLNDAYFDLKQVEILKGPQALFFGKNATAGVISFTTNDPGDTFEAYVHEGYEFTQQQNVLEGVVSGPITDTLGARLAVHWSDMMGGYLTDHVPALTMHTFDIATLTVENHPVAAPPADQPQAKDFAMRGTVKYSPTNNFSATLKASYSNSHEINPTSADVMAFCPYGNVSQVGGDPCGRNWNIYQNWVPKDIAATNRLLGRHGGALYQDYDAYNVTGLVNYKTSDVAFNWVTGYQDFVNYFLGDYDFTSNPDGVFGSERSGYRAFSTELRAQTTLDGPLNAMVGLYYQTTTLDFDQEIIFPGAYEDSSVANHQYKYLTLAKLSRTSGTTFAGFGQVIWDILPGLEFTGGARYTHETKTSFFRQPYVIAPYQAVFVQYDPANPATQLTANQTFDNISPEATLTWKPTDNLTAYVAYKQGYKSGGFSGSALYSAGTTSNDLAFNPERAQGWEGGVKSTWFNDTLRVDATLFNYRYSNLQIDWFDGVHVNYITFNAGSAITRGVELSADWAPEQLQGFTLHGTASYDDAFYSNFPDAPCNGGQSTSNGCNIYRYRNPANPAAFLSRPCNIGAEVCNAQNLTGASTANAPKWIFSINPQYATPIDSRFILTLSGIFHYTSKYAASQFNDPNAYQKGYWGVDGNISLADENGIWEISLIGKNLTDQFVVNNMIGASGSGAGTGTPTAVLADEYANVGLPRTIMLQATLHSW
jgi:outer membrane receptor protein involved in Fe transport